MAYAGIREHHKTIEIIFATLVFSLVTTASLLIANIWLIAPASAIIAFVATVIVGAIWRKWGRDLLRWIWRSGDISWSDDSPSALASLLDNSRHPISQVAVQIDDGTWLSCHDAEKFNDAPFGCCIFGAKGDIALYLTHEEILGSPLRELTTVRDDNYGDRITYIPANRVKRVTIRHKRRV
jgi:hypothetical protein